MRAAAIILAGGASTRMGSPKALLEYQGQTFLDRLVEVFSPYCESVIAVVGHGAGQIRQGSKSGALFVENPDWERGQLTSLQAGLRAIPPVEAIFFTPVDFPAIPREVPSILLRALLADSSFAVPSYNGKHGHPILFRSGIASQFLELPPEATARDVVHRHVDSTVYVDVQHEGILVDIDYPADYDALVGGSS